MKKQILGTLFQCDRCKELTTEPSSHNCLSFKEIGDVVVSRHKGEECVGLSSVRRR